MFSEKRTFVTSDTTHKRDVGKGERNADHSDQVAPRKMTNIFVRRQINPNFEGDFVFRAQHCLETLPIKRSEFYMSV